MTSQCDCKACWFGFLGMKPEDHNMKHTCKLGMDKTTFLKEHPELAKEIFNDGILAAITKSGCGMNKSAFDLYVKAVVPQPEWRILEFVNPKDGSIWIMGNNGYYTHGDSVAFAEHVLLKMIETHDYYIRKVRRNSDGTIWIIGDNVNIAGTSLDGRGLFDVKIKRFNIHGSTMKVVIDSGGYALLSELQKIDQEKKPEWEILEFTNSKNGFIWIRGKKGYYTHGDLPACAEHVFLDAINTNQSNYSIRKVRRLSDKEVFTVGDETDKGMIEKFILCKDNTLLAIRPHSCFPVSYLRKPERKCLFICITFLSKRIVSVFLHPRKG